jgi:hypothetical protein
MRLHSVHQDSGPVDPLSWYHFHGNEPHEPTRLLSGDPRGSSPITPIRRETSIALLRIRALRSGPTRTHELLGEAGALVSQLA